MKYFVLQLIFQKLVVISAAWSYYKSLIAT